MKSKLSDSKVPQNSIPQSMKSSASISPSGPTSFQASGQAPYVYQPQQEPQKQQAQSGLPVYSGGTERQGWAGMPLGAVEGVQQGMENLRLQGTSNQQNPIQGMPFSQVLQENQGLNIKGPVSGEIQSNKGQYQHQNIEQSQEGQQQGLQEEQQVCTYYVKTGKCAYGDRCKFHHPADRPAQVLNSKGYPMRANERDCAYYLKTGECSFGSTCRYNHPQPHQLQEIQQQQQIQQQQLQQQQQMQQQQHQQQQQFQQFQQYSQQSQFGNPMYMQQGYPQAMYMPNYGGFQRGMGMGTQPQSMPQTPGQPQLIFVQPPPFYQPGPQPFAPYPNFPVMPMQQQAIMPQVPVASERSFQGSSIGRPTLSKGRSLTQSQRSRKEQRNQVAQSLEGQAPKAPELQDEKEQVRLTQPIQQEKADAQIQQQNEETETEQ